MIHGNNYKDFIDKLKSEKNKLVELKSMKADRELKDARNALAP